MRSVESTALTATAVLGVDPGGERTQLAVVLLGKKPGQPDRANVAVVEVLTVPNEALAEALEDLLRRYPVREAVVERTAWWIGPTRAPFKALRRVEKVGKAVAKLLEERGIRVERPLAYHPRAWQGEAPGWRQRFTGLTRPSEDDVGFTLDGLVRGGRVALEAKPSREQVDAVGLALLPWLDLEGRGKGE